MKDKSKTKAQLIDELIFLRQQISAMEEFSTAHKRGGQSIGDALQFNQTILAASPVGILTYNSSGQCVSANEASSKIVGGTIEQLLSQNFRQIESWKKSGMRDAAEKALSKGQNQELETHIVTTFGKERWSFCRFAPFHHEGMLHLLLLISDITERKRMEETLIESEARLMQAQAIAHLGSWEIDLTNQVMWGSEEAFRIYGIEYPGPAFACMPLIEVQKVVHPEDRPGMDDALRALLHENRRYDQTFRIFRVNDGALRVIHSRADLLFSEKRIPMKVFGTIQDISERNRAEEELRESEEKYRLLVENASEAIFIAQGGVLKFVNQATIQMLGYSGEEITSLPFTHFIHPDDREMVLERHVKRLKGEEIPPVYPFRIVTRHGNVRWVEIHAVFISWKDKPATLNFVSDITDRTQVETALREGEERYKNFVEKSFAGVYVVQNGFFVYLNDNAAFFAGYSPEELIGKRSEEIIHSEDLSRTKEKAMKMLRGEDLSPYEFRIVTKDGQIRWIMETVSSIQYAGRKAILGNSMDITDRKRAEEALREGEQRLQSIVNGSPIPAFVIGKDHRVIHWNKALEEMSGIKSKEVLGTNMHWKAFYNEERPCMADLLVDESVELVPQWYAGKCTKSPLIEDAYETTDFFPLLEGKGKWLRFTAAAIRDSKGMIVAAVETLEDITERRKAEEQLRESEERFRALSENAPDIIYTMNLLGAITYVNPSWKRILGHDEEEILGRYFIEFAKEEDMRTYKKLFKSIRDKEKSVNNYIGVMLTKDGKERIFNMNSAFIRDSEGRITGVVGSMKDVTELRDIEKKLSQAEKMEAIGTLAGGIAHDFNNILAAILGYTQLVIDTPDGEQRKRYLNQVLKSGERAKNLTSQILAFSRQDQQERGPIEAGGIVKEAMKLLRSLLPTTIEIRQEIEAGPSVVLSNAIQIHQVLMNLCTNAAHAMRDKGGVLEVRLDHIKIPSREHPMVVDLQPGSYIKLMVKDTGHGIDPGIIDRIFDPFFTTKKVDEGTGLGLSVAYGIAKSHGGTIHVQSTLGKGSTFSAYFPQIEEETEKESEKPQFIVKGSERVLFVDDEPFLAEIGREGLSALGYEVTVRTSSIEALHAFRARPERFDLVITDMTMPNMTGVQLADEILKVRPDIPIILCTGYSEAIDEEKSKKFGIRAFIMKPVSLEEVARTIRKVLDK